MIKIESQMFRHLGFFLVIEDTSKFCAYQLHYNMIKY